MPRAGRFDRTRDRCFPWLCFGKSLFRFGVNVPSCYLITLCSGASLDQHSNNISLFNLVEQIYLPATISSTKRRIIPLEVHAYLRLQTDELNRIFEFRYALVSQNGLDAYSEPITHQIKTMRYRMRSIGLPMPLVVGEFSLHLEYRLQGDSEFIRDRLAWPLHFKQDEVKPSVTH